MKRVFLSHSSADKVFVRGVADILGDVAIIDERDIAAGARVLDEIVEKMEDSAIFVIFLSQEAIESDWVQKELSIAIDHSRKNEIEILVFSLDKTVSYTDKRLPDNLRKHYNIKVMRTAEIAASRIKDAVRMLKLKESPTLREVETLFIGRGNQVRQFETDFSTLDGEIPTFLVAYNYYAGIGRRHFVKHVLNKINLYKHTQSPVTITLRKGESLENVIIKLNTVVFKDEAFKADLRELSYEKKIELLLDLIKEYKKNNRIIFIIDEGAIVLPNHKLVDWFDKVAQAPELHNRTTFCLISNWEPNYRYLQKENRGACYHIDELDSVDTQNLFGRLLNIYGNYNLSSQIKKDFISHLTGIPAQIVFAVQQIKVLGAERALSRLEDISSHSDSYSAALIESIKLHPLAYQICLVLAYGSISLDVVYDVFGETDEVREALVFLADYSAVDYISGNITSVKLNTTISDFIKRRNIEPASEHKNRFNKAISNYLEKSLDSLAQDDYSKFILALEDCVRRGVEIPSKYYIAPLLINNIIQDYNSGNYQAVETYCLNLMRQHNFDPQVQWELQYHLAKVYARTGRQEFWKVLNSSELDYINREFLIGFYYRNKNTEEEIRTALEHFENVLAIVPSHRRSKRERVNTYLLLDEYDDALKYAKENYEENPTDILHLQSYFICLMRSNNVARDMPLIEELMKNARVNTDPRAIDIYACMRGEYEYWINNDFLKAETILNEATKTNENKRYPLKALLILYRKEGKFEEAIKIKKELSKL